MSRPEPHGRIVGPFGLLLGSAGRLLAAVLLALVGRKPWGRPKPPSGRTRPESTQ